MKDGRKVAFVLGTIMVSSILIYKGYMHKEINTNGKETEYMQSVAQDKKEAQGEEREEVAEKNSSTPLEGISKEELEIFFTKIAETNFPPFKEKEIPEGALLQFGILQERKYHPERLERIDANYARLPAVYVEQVIDTFFRIKLKANKPVGELYGYKDGFYILPYRAPIPNVAAKVTQVQPLGEGEYDVTFTLYGAPPDTIFDKTADIKQWKKQGNMPSFIGKRRGRIKRIKENGKERFILVQYSKIST